MNKTYLLTATVILSLFFASCNRKIRYIYNENQKKDTVFVYNIKSEPYKLKPKDVLHIKIITTEKSINELFKIEENMGNTNINNNNFYLTGFTVNDSGYVDIPVLGKIKAAGKTVGEFRNDLIKTTRKYLKDAIVSVKMVSFKISFLGEINNKGTIYIYQDNIDILEAVARAGGVTDYADMKSVTIVRNKEGKRLIYKLDLTERQLLTSDKFYLYPDDIIIVDPVKAKIAKMNFQDYFYFFSAFSAALSTTALIINIFK